MEWKCCVNKHFEKPAACRNADQIRFYISELSNRMREFESAGIQIPDWAASLLAQYNLQQNKLVLAEFQTRYAR